MGTRADAFVPELLYRPLLAFLRSAPDRFPLMEPNVRCAFGAPADLPFNGVQINPDYRYEAITPHMNNQGGSSANHITSAHKVIGRADRRRATTRRGVVSAPHPRAGLLDAGKRHLCAAGAQGWRRRLHNQTRSAAGTGARRARRLERLDPHQPSRHRWFAVTHFLNGNLPGT